MIAHKILTSLIKIGIHTKWSSRDVKKMLFGIIHSFIFAIYFTVQWNIAGNDVNIFVSSVFNGEYYIKSSSIVQT